MELIEREERRREEKRNLYAPLQAEPIDLDEIFQVMIDSIRYQYVGYEQQKRAFTPTEYRTYILSHHRYNTLTLQMLVRSLHQFAADMHDRNLVFHCDDWVDYRNTAALFRVRAEKDCLWVTEALPESPVQPGDRLLRIQRMTPEEIRRYMRYNSFYSREPERELWGGYLRMAGSAEVERPDGRRETVALPAVPAREITWPIVFQMLGDAAYIKLERTDRDALEALVREHEDALSRAGRLILDLRRCVGGDEGAALPLLPWIVDREYTLRELLDDRGSYVNCTPVNCELRYRVLSEFEEGLEDGEERELLRRERQFYLENYGKGLVYRPPEPVDERVIRPRAEAPKRVVLLTDTFCEHEGEQLAALVQRCGSKVVTLGRPTMGTLDTFDPITVRLNAHMTLSYPIAMTAEAFEGRGIADKGLPVDIYVPWTPEEIRRDVLLEQAMTV